MQSRRLLVFLATYALVFYDIIANAAPYGGTKTGVQPAANHAGGIPGAGFTGASIPGAGIPGARIPQHGLQGAGALGPTNTLAGIHGGSMSGGGMSLGENGPGHSLVTLPGHAPGSAHGFVPHPTASGSFHTEGVVGIGGTGSGLHGVLHAGTGQGQHNSGLASGGHQGSQISQMLPQRSPVGFAASAVSSPGGPSVTFGQSGAGLGLLSASHSDGLGPSGQAGPLAAGSAGYGNHGGSSSSASGFSVSRPQPILTQGPGSGFSAVALQGGSPAHILVAPAPAPAVVVVSGASAGAPSGSPISHARNTAPGIVPSLVTAPGGNLHSSRPALGGGISGGSSGLHISGNAGGVKH